MDTLSVVKTFKKIALSMALMSAIASPFYSLASTIESVDDEIKFTEGVDALNDILVPVAKSAASDISFNEFTNFNVTRPLTIYNGIRASASTNNNDSANVIVISAESLTLNSHIEIIGAPADLLIVSTGNTPFSCNNCSFSNVERLTLVDGTYSNTETIGAIHTRASGSASISNLSAPGIVSVEIMAETITMSGTTDTNFRADLHPESGMIVHEQGAKLIGSGGVNLYSGDITIGYSDLHIKSIQPVGSLNISGEINAASIAMTSAKGFIIPENAKLNTLSDALASSTRNGYFYAPLEGIFLTTLNNTEADIHINGTLSTDSVVDVKSHRNIKFNSSSTIFAKDVIATAIGELGTHGFMQVSNLESEALHYKNTGHIAANKLQIKAENNIFNSYGGKMTANSIKLISNNGAVINGSKSKVHNYDATTAQLSVDLTALSWGIKPASITGTIANDLSAHILANSIQIKAKRLENINPYSFDKPTGANWDSGISVNTTTSNQVSIQAENELFIIADNYVLNSSAIMGLNQVGQFELNTPKLSNERYHLAAGTFKFTQVLLSDDDKISHDIINSGSSTQVTAYSPPGRIYSYGNMKFNHFQENTQSEFINEFSYFEAFQNLEFHKADVKSLGLETSITFTSAQKKSIQRCLVLSRCVQSTTTTSAEAETLFAVHGSVLGINSELSTLSDFTSDNANVETAQILNAAAQYFTTLEYGTSESPAYRYIEESSITIDKANDLVLARAVRCTKVLESNGETFVSDYSCSNESLSTSISALIEPIAEGNIYGTTNYTYAQLLAAANSYIQGLPNRYSNGEVASSTGNTHYYRRDAEAVSEQPSGDITIVYTQYTTVNYGGFFGSMSVNYSLTVDVPLATLVPHITQP